MGAAERDVGAPNESKVSVTTVVGRGGVTTVVGLQGVGWKEGRQLPIRNVCAPHRAKVMVATVVRLEVGRKKRREVDRKTVMRREAGAPVDNHVAPSVRIVHSTRAEGLTGVSGHDQVLIVVVVVVENSFR